MTKSYQTNTTSTVQQDTDSLQTVHRRKLRQCNHIGEYIPKLNKDKLSIALLRLLIIYIQFYYGKNKTSTLNLNQFIVYGVGEI